MKCPDILRKVLDLTSDIELSEDSVYNQFLLEAEKVAHRKETGCLDVTLSSRLTDAATQRDGANSSLVMIFSFYAKLQNPTTQMQKGGLTYDEIKTSNETLSFYETLLLLRDFDVLPKLITKDELLFLWKVGNIQNISAGKPVLRMLTFRDFLDLLAKIAVFAYSKPGLRQLAVSLNGEPLTALEQVQSLAAYLHLDDVERVRHVVRTVSVETAGLLHNRSEGEKNHRTIQYLKDDLRGARMAHYLSREGRHQVEAAGTDSEEIMDNDPQAVRIAHELWKNMNGPSDSIPSLDEGSAAAVPATQKKERSLVSDIMCSINASESAYLNSAVCNMYVKDAQASSKDRPDDKLPISGLYVPRVHICEAQERALVQFRSSLSKEFLKYAVENTYSGLKLPLKNSYVPDESAVFEPSGAAFVDIGPVPPGKACSIRVVVINRGSHEANVQISTKGFLADELTIIKLPGAIAPGLRQVIIVKFLPPKDYIGGCLCTVSITSVTNPSNMIFQEESTVHCPVYYTVTSDSASSGPESSSRCTLRSLPSLLALHQVSSGTKSTEELTLFSRSKSKRPGLDVTHALIPTAINGAKSSKTRRLSVRHSLR